MLSILESDKAGKGTKNTGVQASLLGVGAPEALVIGVVALLVFGPKGLAEVLTRFALVFIFCLLLLLFLPQLLRTVIRMWVHNC